MQYFIVSATGGRPSVMHAGLYYIYCVSTAKLHSICCYCYRFGYKMSMFVLIYGAIFSLHFFSYKCDGKSLLYIHNISEYTRHTCLSVTVCCMAVRRGTRRIRVRRCRRVVYFAYPRIALFITLKPTIITNLLKPSHIAKNFTYIFKLPGKMSYSYSLYIDYCSSSLI